MMTWMGAKTAVKGAWLGVWMAGLGCAARPPLDQHAPDAQKTRPFEELGRLVCLLEEMKSLHGADFPPVHEHLLGFRLDQKVSEGEPRYLVIFRNSLSEALFVDRRFQEHLLLLEGRVFPGTALLEVQRFNWVRDGQLYEVTYWCEVCAIKGLKPGPCACCQAPVELREKTRDSH